MRHLHRGISLVDVVVGVALLLIIFLALFGVLRASLQLSTVAKAKSAAIELANSQVEYMRGVTYDSLGTAGGIPAGTIPQTATSSIDGVTYTTRTFIEYVDDPADGIGALDTNTVTTDYKIGKVTVSYTIHGLTKSVVVVSNFVPPGIEASTGGGTLAIHIVDSHGADLPGASIHIVNASTSPAINFTTISDSDGLNLIGGAATSTQYQIDVSRTGYSSAQTYQRTSQNINPTPGYLTVVKNQTTSATFAIDLLSTLTLMSYAPAVTTTFSDTFADASKLAVQNDTQVDSNHIILADDAFSGSARSLSIAPTDLQGWGILTLTITTPGGTTALVHIADGSGTLVSDADLPGNSAGFSTSPISLTGLSTTTHPVLSIEGDLTTNSTSTTPWLRNWSLSYTTGPSVATSTSFTLTGAKTIGTDTNSKPIYKTTISTSTGATGKVTQSLEWDAYSLTTSGIPFIDSCPEIPYPIAAGTASSSQLLVGTLTTNTLPLIIETTASTSVPNAKVILTKSGYAATISTNTCGAAFFNNLSSGTYTATVSATGHSTTAFPSISVSGHTATTTLVLP